MLEDVISAAPPSAPITDDHSAAVLDDALARLGTLRALQWLGDGATQLHLLASLRDEIEGRITEAATLALDQEHTPQHVARLLGHDTTARRNPTD